MSGGAVTIVATVAERGFDVTLDLEAGQVVAVLGANGAGKSTLLALIAGLLAPDEGRIVIDGHVLVDTANGTWTPPHRRGVVLLAQDPLLFPHMTAATNVAFGPRSAGAPSRAARTEADRWLTAVDAAQFADRRPAELSGGQAQRIAVARALAADPALLLLDEPMAALDVAVAPALRQLLRRVLRDARRTALLVTHDILDALSLADRVIVLEAGRVVEDGPTRAVLTSPRSAFAARIAGVNLIGGTATADGLVTGTGTHIRGRRDAGSATGDRVVAIFRPTAVAVHLDVPTGSPRNDIRVTVAELEPLGDVIRVHATDRGDPSSVLIADVTAAAAADLELLPGLDAHFAVKATEVAIHPAGV